MPNTSKLVEIDHVREKLIELFADSEYMSYEKKADYLIANSVTVQQWIPVAERLPENEGRYLCVLPVGRRSGAEYVQVMNGDKHGFSMEHIYNDDVTHWMPLPEPPRVRDGR